MKPEELDELERLAGEATGGKWKPLLNAWHTALVTDDESAALYRDEIAPEVRCLADAVYIAALHNAFPGLLALARDGVRYRWLMSMRYNLGEEASKSTVFVDPVFMAIKNGHPPDQKSINATIDAAIKELT